MLSSIGVFFFFRSLISAIVNRITIVFVKERLHGELEVSRETVIVRKIIIIERLISKIQLFAHY